MIGCFVAVRDRQLFLRTCLMQLHLQTQRPDVCLLLINGPNAAKYDLRCVEDLLDTWIVVRRVPERLTTRQASCHALLGLLEFSVQMFFKIDSDDIYQREYFAEYLTSIEASKGQQVGEGYCSNLVHQYWLNARPGGAATIQKVDFLNGLGLSERERLRGVRIGAPPTFAFDRRVAELLTAQSHLPPYDQIDSDDRCWRTILIDHGIVIHQLSTSKPVFGYLRHLENTSKLQRSDQGIG